MSVISTEKGRRFGGFTNLPWQSSSIGSYKGNDPEAFIFSLDHKTKLTCHQQEKVIYCGSFVVFGGGLFGGHDIYIADNFSGSYSNCGVSYGKNEGITDQHYLTGNEWNTHPFTPTELEVYQVIKL